MVTDDVIPRDADESHGLVEAAEERQIVEHDVAEGYSELGFGADYAFHHVVGDVVYLGLVSRLGITEENHAELSGFLLSAKWKVDRLRQRSGRSYARMLCTLRGTLGLVDVMKPRKQVLAQGDHPTARLEYKIDDVFRNGQTPMPLGIRLHYI